MKRPSSQLLLLAALVVALLAQPSSGDQQQHLHDTTAAAVATADGALHADSSLTPPVWPEQFKSVMFQNRTNRLALVTLYYDWKLGANLNIISSQLGAAGTVWDLEWNNGERHTAAQTPKGWLGLAWLANKAWCCLAPCASHPYSSHLFRAVATVCCHCWCCLPGCV